MARQITKELAMKIVNKLKATAVKDKSKAHDFYELEVDGQVFAHVSIRRGSEKDQGHDYIPRDLYLQMGEAKKLGQCAMTREGYVALMRARDILPPLERAADGEDSPKAEPSGN